MFSGPRERAPREGGSRDGSSTNCPRRAEKREFLVISSKLGQDSSCEILYYIIQMESYHLWPIVCLAFVTEHNVSKVRPQCSMHRHLIPLYGQVIFHCAYGPHLVHRFHSSDGRHWLFAPVAALVNHTAGNIHVQAFICTLVCSSLEYMSRSGIAGSCDNYVYLLRNHQTIFPFNFEHRRANRQVERLV